MTNEELIKEWKEGEARQKALWNEILSRGLYLQVLGIDSSRRDSAWRTPPSATGESVSRFFAGVHGSPARFKAGHNRAVPKVSMSKEELAEFD